MLQLEKQQANQLNWYSFNPRMLPEHIHPKPVYRRLNPRTETELAKLAKLTQKQTTAKKRKSVSLQPSKGKQQISAEPDEEPCLSQGHDLDFMEVTEEAIHAITKVIEESGLPKLA